MDETQLQVFIDGTIHYFSQASEDPADIGTPYLINDDQTVADEYTGIIGISGKRRGTVYFTAGPGLLKVLLMSLGETDLSHEFLCDLVGEVANTISGNARRSFGADFMISVPLVVKGQPERIHSPKNLRSFVIPISWRGHQAALVITVE